MLLCAVCLSACGNRAQAVLKVASPEPEQGLTSAQACPKPDEPYIPAMCEGLPADHGTQPNHALEWGERGVGELLWEGRLSCTNGTTPHMMRLSPYGPPPVPSTTTTSNIVVGASDVLDRWRVSCSGFKPVTLYHNIYRCASACPPGGLVLVPAIAWRHYRASIQAYQKSQATEALEHSTKAIEASAEHETLLNWHALMLSEAGKWTQALTLYERVASMNPHSQTVHIRKAEVLLLLKRKVQAGDVLRGVLSVLERNDTRRPYLTCLLSTSLMVTDPQKARDLSQQACREGERACCD